MNDIYELTETAANSYLKHGYYATKVSSKHVEKYGDKGAHSTRDTVSKILAESIEQSADPTLSNNVLLVGKVQSGKTSNLEMLTALAFDNGFQIMVLFGGYTGNLLDQSMKRFKEIFDIPDYDEDTELEASNAPLLVTTAEDSKTAISINGLSEEDLRHVLDQGTPIIIACMKQHGRIKQVSDKLSFLKNFGVKAFVIDDEGDQASLNNARNKHSDASSTYRSICVLKESLGDPLYFSVTATPQANVFLDELSQLIPSRLHLLNPAEGYCGADKYHLSDPGLVETSNEDFEGCLDDNKSPDSLKTAIRHFLIASTILSQMDGVKKRDRSEMIIHAKKEIAYHRKIGRWVKAYLSDLQGVLSDAVEGNTADAFALFRADYRRLFDKTGNVFGPFDESFIELLEKTARETVVLLQNSQEKNSLGSSILYKHRIHIGADLLQRGITFDHLLTTFFVRWAKTGGNMDTNLQRARWFGYREPYFSLTRLFTTEEIAQEFSYLGDMEDDLWTQMDAVERGEKEISSIRILAERTNQRPTRRSVANYSIIRVDDWAKQSCGLFSPDSVKRSNSVVESFLDSLSFSSVSIGRAEGKGDEPTSLAAYCTVEKALELIKNLDEGAFDGPDGRFSRAALLKKIRTAGSIRVFQMSCGHQRHRSFYVDSNKVVSLQQGRDRQDINEASYLGDKAVIDKDCDISIQIHSILPLKNEREYPEYSQYLLAIYDERETPPAYVRKD